VHDHVNAQGNVDEITGFSELFCDAGNQQQATSTRLLVGSEVTVYLLRLAHRAA
jgi:hypothetical protein